jgi:mannose-6-phosphate isomerase-like protein (cupin superfamily)
LSRSPCIRPSFFAALAAGAKPVETLQYFLDSKFLHGSVAMPDSPVSRLQATPEFATPERCIIIETYNIERSPALSIARARVEPGVTTAWHSVDGTVERYIIAEGRGRVEVGDFLPEEVAPGDVVTIPAGVRQRISNVGSGDLIFYCVCTPRFEVGNYRALE